MRPSDKNHDESNPRLIELAGVSNTIAGLPPSEGAWMDVVQKMDEVYADLVQNQVELEEKNAALEETQQFITSVLSAMTDVLVVCDIDGRIEQANAACQGLTGKDIGALLGQPLATLFQKEERVLADRFLNRIREGEAVVDHEASFLDAGGQPTPLTINCSSRYDHEGRLVGMVIIGRPIGELRRAYRDLDQAHRKLGRTQQQLISSEKMAALGRLVAGVAHELNNPISFVFGNMHALKRYGERITTYLRALDNYDDPERIRELREELRIDRILNDVSPLVEGTLEGAERVSDIVQDLRRFSAGQKELDECFDLVKVVKTATQWVVKSARIKPELHLELPKRLEVVGRKGAVHQILVNLVQNAVDVLVNRQDPQIWIACETAGDNFILSVRDNGPGISEADLPHIFEPFYTTKPLGKGTGMGLYVSYTLAEEQGGRLDVSKNEGGGADFRLTLNREGGHVE